MPERMILTTHLRLFDEAQNCFGNGATSPQCLLSSVQLWKDLQNHFMVQSTTYLLTELIPAISVTMIIRMQNPRGVEILGGEKAMMWMDWGRRGGPR